MVIDSASPDRKGWLTRRRFLTGLGAAGFGALAWDGFIREPNRVVVSRHILGEGARQDGPALTFVQLSDLHLRRIGDRELRTAAMVNALRPDFIVLTGDSVDRQQGLKHLATFLGLLDRETPKYAILGNREYFDGVDFNRLRATYRQANGRLLVNETAVHRHGEMECLVTGVDDLVAGKPDLDRALAGASPGPNHLLLAHCPAYRDELVARMPGGRCEVDGRSFPLSAVLSGHTHGGQITLFGLAPVLPPGSGGYTSGWYGERPPRLYVSRGIGTSTLPVRLMAPPEVVCFRWHLATPGKEQG